jgi:hypothetical protein
MFARQIAVMKGQAWNVVETLKQPDHGPLELTRRTRVYVWDDLVNVPVAIPMRPPSTEARRHHAQALGQDDGEEEMDISAAVSSAPGPDHDLLGFSASTTGDLPNPNRFELARSRTSTELGSIGEEPGRDSDVMFDQFDLAGDRRDFARSWASQPPRPSQRARGNTTDSTDVYQDRSSKHVRHSSLSHRRGSSQWSFGGADDLEGDLGYAAAEGMEGNERKVIVERLEAVKSKNPIFTWC